LDVVANSIFMSSLGLDGSMLIFKKPRTWKEPLLRFLFIWLDKKQYLVICNT
jgi:hypothetical protein